MPNLFTYGTLMFEEVWKRLVTGDYQRIEATLTGYLRRSVRGESYPVIIRGSGSEKLSGVVYLGLSNSDLQRLDRFEGDYYYRTRELVDTAAGDRIPAEVYVLKARYRGIATPDEWSPESFIRNRLSGFLTDYQGF